MSSCNGLAACCSECAARQLSRIKRYSVRVYTTVCVQSSVPEWLVFLTKRLVVSNYSIHLLYICKSLALEQRWSGIVAGRLDHNYIITSKFGDWEVLGAIYDCRIGRRFGSHRLRLIRLKGLQGYGARSILTRGYSNQLLIVYI